VKGHSPTDAAGSGGGVARTLKLTSLKKDPPLSTLLIPRKVGISMSIGLSVNSCRSNNLAAANMRGEIGGPDFFPERQKRLTKKKNPLSQSYISLQKLVPKCRALASRSISTWGGKRWHLPPFGETAKIVAVKYDPKPFEHPTKDGGSIWMGI